MFINIGTQMNYNLFFFIFVDIIYVSDREYGAIGYKIMIINRENQDLHLD